MKTVITFITFLLLFSCSTSGQTITIDENFRVDSTEIKFKSDYGNFIAYSTIDNKNLDFLKVRVESIGLTGYVLSINFVKPITVEMVIYSDGNEFDGKHHMTVELEKFELTINKDKLELGDKLMGVISGETKEFIMRDSTYKIYFDGHFHHIIGKVLRKRYEGDKYDSYDPRH